MKPKWKHQIWTFTAGPYGSSFNVFQKRDRSFWGRIWNPKTKQNEEFPIPVTSRPEAVEYAEEQSRRRVHGLGIIRRGDLPLERVTRLYLAEQSRHKGSDEQRHDARCSAMSRNYFGADKDIRHISLADWDGFTRDRKSGAIDASGLRVPEEDRRPVGDRTVERDLVWLRRLARFLQKCRGPNGHRLLRDDPFFGYPIPRERNPRRAIASQDRLERTLAFAPQVLMDAYEDGKRVRVPSHLPELLVIVNGTGRRISAVCQLQYADLLLHDGTPHGSIRWRAEADKMRCETVAPVNADVRAALDEVIDKRPGIGAAYLFPCSSIPDQPVRYETASEWLRKAERLAGLEPLPGSLWHAYRRKWATERKHLPHVDVAAAGGWASARTLTEVYQQSDPKTMLDVVLNPVELREAK